MITFHRTAMSIFVAIFFLSGCNENDNQSLEGTESPISKTRKIPTPYLSEWIDVNSAIKKDPQIEAEVQRILALMTLEEKVGQMIQPDIRDVTPEEAKEYKLGSILNGGGGFPNSNKYSSAKDWANEADKYWLALEQAYKNRGFRIPFMWATDAVHGHNNVFGATVFPHNIGLGAARNPDLIEKIGVVTAREVAATGLDWTFAPTVATPRDYRWGRVYEGYSEDPEIVYQYAASMVKGLQGDAVGLKTDTHVISNVKHWLGDGGTLGGVDHGQNRYTEEYLRNIHAIGYYGGLQAGAQVVMSSFNSWWSDSNYDPMSPNNGYAQNKKIHGSKYLITDVLKGKMGFDGVVVTDWNGQGEISGCSASNCAQAVIAGNDVFMVTARSDWQLFYRNVIKQVKDGTISVARIDDAVSRILRVKLRANLWDKPQPSARSLAGDQAILRAPRHVAIARQAVTESLVLLKNNNSVLPLNKGGKFLVAGSAANDITKQTGGWSLTWQGDGNTIDRDFPNAQTLLMAIRQEVGEANIFTDAAATNPQESVAVVVIGEDPYAEMFGDISDVQTLEYSTLKKSYAADLQTIKSLKAAGYRVVTIFYSGRPLYVNEEINNSDAFVAAWLPGTEGRGITDVLFANAGADFKGKLSYSWGAMKCSTTINRAASHIANYTTPVDGITGELIEQDIVGEHAPLFPYGYGLNYSGKTDIGSRYQDLNNIPLDPLKHGCGLSKVDSESATTPLEVFGKNAKGEFLVAIAGSANGWAKELVSKDQTTIGTVTTTGINYDGMQQSALNVKFVGNIGEYKNNSAAQLYMQTVDGKGADYSRYLNANATLEFDLRMLTSPPDSLILATHCEYPCMGAIKFNKFVPVQSDKWRTVKVPLACFADQGMLFQKMNTPFLMYSEDAVEFDVGKIRFVPNNHSLPADAVSCSDLMVAD